MGPVTAGGLIVLMVGLNVGPFITPSTLASETCGRPAMGSPEMWPPWIVVDGDVDVSCFAATPLVLMPLITGTPGRTTAAMTCGVEPSPATGVAQALCWAEGVH